MTSMTADGDLRQANPLEGVRVLELTQGIAGPYAAKLFAIMGAEVVKAEPPAGDVARSMPPFLGGTPHPDRSGLFLYLNTNKRGITLDIETPGGQATARRLYEWADVVLEDRRPGELDALGLGYEALSRVNPRGIMVSVTPFGQHGPYADWEASDLVTLALGGMLYITGDPAREPLKMGGRPSEYYAGLAAFSGAMIALTAREAIGEGQHVDVSAMDGIGVAQGYSSLNWAYLKEDRGRLNAFAPMFRAKDGWVGAMFRQDNWADFCQMIGRPDMITDPKFRDAAGRRDNTDELNAIVGEWMLQQPKQEMYHRAQRQRMPFGYICDAQDLLESPQYLDRGYFLNIDHPATGPLTYPGMPMRWGDDQWTVLRAPMLGEHNDEVYGELLGYTADDVAALRGVGTL